MVIKLELNRSYGQQNEDIAKKNKYNNVQIPVITVTDETEVSDNSDILIPISIESTNNTDTGNIWSAEGINKNTTSTASIGKEYVPTYIGQVEYKTYTITVTENDDMYLYLSNLKNIPEYSYNFSGTIYKETGKRNSGMAFSNDSYVDYRNELNSIELKKNITYTPDEFTENQYNITNNIYQYQDDNSETISVNAVDELNNIIQNASETVADGYISNILNYTKPTITKWTNNSVDKTITIEVQCPYSIKFLSSPNGIKRVMYTSYQYSLYEYEYYEYTFSSASIEVFNNLNISQETQTFFSGDRMYSASNSYLFTNENYLFPASSNISYAYTFANEIYESYKNGKLTLDISYPINQIYDTLDSNVVYIEGHGICKEEDGSFFDIDGNIIDMTNNPKISYNVSLEEGLTCIITKNGESVYKNSDGTDKYFVIQNVNLVYAGILVNEITLIEDATEPDEFSMKYIQPSHSEITVYASGVAGALPSGSSVDKGATLSIYADFDYGYGLADDLMNINDQNVEKFANGYWVWTVTGDVIIKPNVIYLGGKYVTYTKDNNCTLHVVTAPLGGGASTELESGTEIFTNQTIDIYGTINDGYKGILTINGEEQELTPSGQYDFYIYYQVENSNLNIELKTEDMSVNLDINDNATQNLIITRQSSIWSDNSVTNITENTPVYIGDVLSFSTTETNYVLIVNGDRYFSGQTYTVTGDIKISLLTDKVVLSELTWEEIDTVANLGQGVTDMFTIGDEKQFTLLNGTTLTAVLLGTNQDQLTTPINNSSFASLTFGIKELLPTTAYMNETLTSVGGWGESYMRNTIMNSIFNQIPEDLKSTIKSVEKSYFSEYKTGTVVSADTSSDKIWLFSAYEISGMYGSSNYLPMPEGQFYTYWQNNNTNSARIKYLQNNNEYSYSWWLRTIYYDRYNPTGAGMFQKVSGKYMLDTPESVETIEGTISYGNANTEKGICFGFCI